MRKRDLAHKARLHIGPVLKADIICMECDEEFEVAFTKAPEIFICPGCGERAALRDDAIPYPPPQKLRPM